MATRSIFRTTWVYVLTTVLVQVAFVKGFADVIENLPVMEIRKTKSSHQPGYQNCLVDSTVLPYSVRTKPTLFCNNEHHEAAPHTGRDYWLPLGPDGGYVIDLQIDPQNREILYAGTYSGGGAFKTTDSGNSWNNIGLSSAYIMTIAIDPQTPSIVHAGSYWGSLGCFKSTDGGTTWIQHSVNNHNVSKIVINAQNTTILYAATWGGGNGVYKSTDVGESWFQTGLTFGSVYTLAIDPQIPINLYASIYHSSSIYLYKTTDGGDSWSQTAMTERIDDIAIHPDTTSILYAGAWDGVYKSTDYGETWTQIGLFGRSIMSVAIDPLSTGTLYAGELDAGMFKSTDGGSSWTGIGLTGADVRAIVIHPLSPDTLYAGTFRGNACAVYKSTDSGNSWSRMDHGLTNQYFHSIAADPSTPANIYAGTGLNDGLYKSTDNGSTWWMCGLMNQGTIYDVAVHPDSSSVVYAVTYNGQGAFKSTNAGGSWFQINNGLGSTNIFALAMDQSDPDNLYVGTSAGVYKSTNGGVLWQSSGLPSYAVYKLAIDPNLTSTIYAGTLNDGMFRSTDQGGSWAGINSGLTNTQVRAIAINPLTTTDLYVGTYGGGIFKSTNQGTSWNHCGLSNLRVMSFAVSPFQSDTIYAGTWAENLGDGKGVYRSTDAGNTWTEWNEGLPSEKVMALVVSGDSMLLAATYGNSVYARHEEFPGVWEDNSELFKNHVASLQVHPNPFSQKTEIRIQMQARPASRSEAGDVRCNPSTSLGTGMQDILLKIYDATGRLIKCFNLASVVMLPASAVSWDGTDQLNRPVPAGVYFVRLTTPGQTYTEKVILLK